MDNDADLREILASCYERQLQLGLAAHARAGLRTYDICAALDAMRRVRDACQYEPIVGAFSGLVYENAPCMRCGKPKVEHAIPLSPVPPVWPEPSGDYHIHCTELVGTMKMWTEVKRPCSKCDWGHDASPRADLIVRLIEFASAQDKNHLPRGAALVREAIAAISMNAKPTDEELAGAGGLK